MEEELCQALEAISPATCTYQDWLTVGMALKQAGLPVTLWEQWSARDGSRYHKGECARKWETFRGSPAPVTENSIFKLARDHGWTGPEGHELGWDDVLQAHEEGRVVDPTGWMCPTWRSPTQRPPGTPRPSSSTICGRFLNPPTMWPMSPKVFWIKTGAAPPRGAGTAPPSS